MDPRLLKGFVRWMINVEWEEVQELVYPSAHHPDYFAEKQGQFERNRWGWFTSLDRHNVTRVIAKVQRIYGG